MEAQQLAGTYTYRSFLNRSEPVDDFNRLKFAQLELQLSVQANGVISGALVFPAAAGAEPQAMDVNGHVSANSPDRFSFTARGRPGTPIADFHYEYDGMMLRRWETGVGQRQTLAGTVLRAEDHGSGPTLARAGQTASFLAVKRDS